MAPTATKKASVKKVTQPKVIPNPELRLFQDLVEKVINAVMAAEKHAEDINDTSPASIKHYTKRAIQRGLSGHRWV